MPWSLMRSCSLIAAVACGIVASAAYIAAIAYKGDFSAGEEFWLVVFAASTATIVHIAACVRDQIVHELRQSAQALEDLPLHISDYGDRREIAGHQLVKRVADVQRQRLHTVD